MLTTVNAAQATNLALTGNNFGQTIIGNAGHNALNGKGGNDILNGGAGNDFFVFDTALGANNIDTIIGYSAASDRTPATPGVVAAGTRSGSYAVMNGTSVAAPRLARRLVHLG